MIVGFIVLTILGWGAITAPELVANLTKPRYPALRHWSNLIETKMALGDSCRAGDGAFAAVAGA